MLLVLKHILLLVVLRYLSLIIDLQSLIELRVSSLDWPKEDMTQIYLLISR